jgi:hypothetical protein
MANENLLDYTEVDPNSHLTVTSARCTYAGVHMDEKCYLYDDKGIGGIDDFTGHTFEWDWNQNSDDFRCAIYGITNTGNKSYDGWNQYIAVLDYNWSGYQYLWLTDDAANSDNVEVHYESTPLYLKCIRSDTAMSCEVYDDAARTNLVGTAAITSNTRAFRYVYAFASEDIGDSGKSGDGYVEDFDLGLAAQQYYRSTAGELGMSGDLVRKFTGGRKIEGELRDASFFALDHKKTDLGLESVAP